MLTTRIGPSGDVASWELWFAVGLALASLVMLAVELRRRESRGAAIAVTGLLATLGLLAAVLRPAHIVARESAVGARVVVLADTSRSMALPQEGAPRWRARNEAIAALSKSAPSARFTLLGFGAGLPTPLALTPSDPASQDLTARATHSALSAALEAIAKSPEERPAAVVVVSDGRLDDPSENASDASLEALGAALRVPIHAIATTRYAPADASVRRVSTAGAAVAHVPMPLRIEVGCAGPLACDEVDVSARELRDDGPPSLLASGVAHLKEGKAALDLTVTLERAGAHIVQVAIVPPAGDTIPENDRRFVRIDVARDHVRVLHVAGRPTNDVRALRRWLKSDASVDVVAFFILRTPTDDVRASPNELALIPFPVDELFTEHLPSFDAVVLQDFDAQPYGLEKYLPNVERYVRGGGGLVMVGGQNSFVAGGYTSTPLARVLPVELDGSPGATSADTSPFAPEWTDEGKVAPLLSPLRNAIGEELPQMPGANVLGDVRPGGVALWSHPTRKTVRGAKMPVLAIGEEGDGRSVALGVDGTWLLEFSQLGARTAGRGHGALWDGLLGWLMRDPRFEPAQMEIAGGCIAGIPSTVRVQMLPTAASGPEGESVSLDIRRIDQPSPHDAPALHLERARSPEASSMELAVPALEVGAYTARLRVGQGTITHYDFACEAGGDEWADSRPDAERLERLARTNGGAFAFAPEAALLPLPKPMVVSAERRVVPVAPPWVWTLVAAVLLGVHWVVRRRSGLS
jgi:uncharacterized membrane protein